MPENDDGAGQIIVKPHNHDVLCGRGGLTNQHAGNEWFRRLVRSNRALYRSCPKHTKLLVAKAIVQAVQQQEPPGRFLEVADKDAGTWRQITYKRAVDKTSQALREKEQASDKAAGSAGNPMNTEVAQLAAQAAARKGKKKSTDLSDLAQATLRQAGLETGGNSDRGHFPQDMSFHQADMDRKRKAQGAADFVKPSWWRQGVPSMDMGNNGMRHSNGGNMNNLAYGIPNKRMRSDIDDSAPVPTEPLQTRQSSLFRFLSGSGIFGRNESGQQQTASMQQRNSGMFPFGGAGNQMNQMSSRQQNPLGMMSMGGSGFNGRNSGNGNMGMQLNQQQSLGMSGLDPLPMNGGTNMNMNNFRQFPQSNNFMSGDMATMSSGSRNSAPAQSTEMEEMPTMGLFPAAMDNAQRMAGASSTDDTVPPPMNRLTTQVSDWLTSFWPLGREQTQGQPQQMQQQPQQRQPLEMPAPPPGQKLERGISSTIMSLARSPSQFLTSLRSGVTSMFGNDDLTPVPVNQQSMAGNMTNSMGMGAPSGSAAVIGTASTGRDSLLDDYEETPLETRLRSVTSR